MNKIKKSKLIILAVACLFTLTNGVIAQKSNQIGLTETSFLVLNEIITDNPGAENNACNYVEIRGDQGSFIGSDTYLVEFEGDGGEDPGDADFVRRLDGATFGLGGILTVHGTGTCGSRDYTAAGGAEISDSGASLEGGTITFMLINAPPTPGFTGVDAILEGTDYDTNDDGTLELPAGATIIDAVGWTDEVLVTLGSVGSDYVYGGVDITPGTGTPMGATRDDGNTTPNSAAAWFAGDIVGDGPDGVTYALPPTLRSNLGPGPGFMIGFLTPGGRNLAPTAAPGTISGRARTGKGMGIKHAVIMLTGGKLTQPIYATTNQFGYYKFEDLTVGRSYTMQIMSGRYTFDNPTRVVNMGDSITNEDFVTSTSIRIESGSRRSETPKNRILKKQ